MSLSVRLATVAFLVALFVAPARAEASEPPWDELEKVARKFVESIAAGRIAESWQLLTKETREETTQDQFTQLVAPYSQYMGSLQSRERESKVPLVGGCGRLLDLVKFDHADIRFKTELCREQGQWRISHFNTEAVRLERGLLARRLIVNQLATAGLSTPLTVKCPGIDEAAVGSTSPCEVDMGEGCTLSLSLLVENSGFVIVGGTYSEGCRSRGESPRAKRK